MRIDVGRMNDSELVVALRLVSRSPVGSLTEWELGFARGVRETYAKYGGFTWKQRQVARRLVERIVDRLERSAAVEQEVHDREERIER